MRTSGIIRAIVEEIMCGSGKKTGLYTKSELTQYLTPERRKDHTSAGRMSPDTESDTESDNGNKL